MIDAIAAVASVALPWCVGALVVRAMLRGTPDATPLVAAGYGYLVGAFAVTIALRAMAAAQLRWNLAVLVGVLVIVGAVAAWLGRGPRAELPRREHAKASLLERVAIAVALALIVIRIGGLATETLVSPLRGYDTWAHWATKARVWLENGTMSRFVTPETWIARGDPSLYTDSNPGHPGNVPLLQVWTALFLRDWSESLINLPWPVLAISLGMAFYAQARLAAAAVAVGAVATALLLSLPVLDGHVVIAGAADIFLAASFGLAAMAAWRWTRTREPPMGALALVCAVAAAMMKAEGVLWVATLLPAVVTSLHRRAGFALAIAALVAFLAYLVLGPERLPLFGYALLSRPVDVTGTLVDHVFVFGNWHLAGYLLVALVVWRRRALLSPALAPMTMTVAAMAGLIVVIFYFTSAAGGVLDETLVNRFLLHAAPTLAFYVLLLFLDARAPSSAAAITPATKAAEA
ncbi:MAG: hypothetical protein ABI585_01580 [Betaproteobacteria bacterium]